MLSTRKIVLALSVLFSSLQTIPVFCQYDFANPCKTYQLPDTLREISGITWFDKNHLACVQDERGSVFIFDIASGKLSEIRRFSSDGDYEGIAKVKRDMYMLRSDGTLFRYHNFLKNRNGFADSVQTNISIPDNEGLCYDAQNNRLLIAAKGRHAASKNLRYIYSFDPGAEKITDSLELAIDVTEISALLRSKNLELPAREKKNGESVSGRVKFMTSAIAVHPRTHDYYLLSAIDGLLLILKPDGQPKDVFLLDRKLFPKAEGIIFSPEGDLFISNEGKGQAATILKFCM